MSKKYFDYEEIIMYLEDIKGYVESYLYLISTNDETIDRKEIDMYMSTIPEIVDDIIEFIDKIYEKESY